jgi:hypothetical protein
LGDQSVLLGQQDRSGNSGIKRRELDSMMPGQLKPVAIGILFRDNAAETRSGTSLPSGLKTLLNWDQCQIRHR